MSDDTEILRTDLIPAPQNDLSSWLDEKRFDAVQRAAAVFAKSDMVPACFKNNAPNCIIAFQMASRLGVDPMMFLQGSYVVSGKPGIESKLMIALVNMKGPFKGPIRWRFEGAEQTDAWSCTAYAIHKADGLECAETVTWKMVKDEGWLGKSGSKWKTIPCVMLKYRSAAWLIRQVCPEVVMGMQTTDEIINVAAIPASDDGGSIAQGWWIKTRLKEIGQNLADYRAVAVQMFEQRAVESLTESEAKRVFAKLTESDAETAEQAEVDPVAAGEGANNANA